MSVLVALSLFGYILAQDVCPLSLTNAAEKSALNEIYTATDGFTWLVNSNWPSAGSSTIDPCCWVGVTCKNILGGGVRVTELNLAYNNLRGTLPDSIGSFRYLQKLFLHQNKIGGSLPAAIGSSLPDLELLFLGNNKFTGIIPTFQNRKMQALYMENNQLQGGFPDLSNMPLLESLDVSNNLLNGLLPQTLSNNVLKDLRANGNKFSGGVPAVLLRTFSLQSVQLGNNTLTGPIPPIGSNVKILDLSNNNLGCYAPDVVGTDLRIKGNKFLCSTGVLRVAGCVNPAIMMLIAPTGPIALSGTLPTVKASFTLSDTDPLRDCPDVFCYLGTQRHGATTLDVAQGIFSCDLKPTSVGSYALSLRTSDGTVITQQPNGGAIVIRVTAGCGGPGGMCNSPQGVCTADGCVCNQAEGWSGTDCNDKICPRNCFEQSMQGTCNKRTGMCMCNANFGGADCSIAQKPCPDAECSKHGQCNKMTGVCQCYPEVRIDPSTGRNFTYRYGGPACATYICPETTINGVPVKCSGHGTCTATACSCQQGFIGADCSIGNMQCGQCPAAATCNGNTGRCVCSKGLEGPNCDRKICPTAVMGLPCSGHGTCDPTMGTCTCQPPYDLLGNCGVEKKECPIPQGGTLPCGGPMFGTCKAATGTCACVNNERAGYTGLACDQPICPAAWQDCNPNQLNPPAGMCVNAACVCNKPWTGKTCAEKECKLGADGSQCSVMSGKGECDKGSGICICLNTGKALDPKTACSSLLCPNSNNAADCGNNGVCEDGKCKCNDKYEGEGCETPKTDPVPIVAGVIGAVCFVLSCAVGVFFLLRHLAIKKLTNA